MFDIRDRNDEIVFCFGKWWEKNEVGTYLYNQQALGHSTIATFPCVGIFPIQEHVIGYIRNNIIRYTSMHSQYSYWCWATNRSRGNRSLFRIVLHLSLSCTIYDKHSRPSWFANHSDLYISRGPYIRTTWINIRRWNINIWIYFWLVRITNSYQDLKYPLISWHYRKWILSYYVQNQTLYIHFLFL